jgi:hypothetical protein
LLCELWWTCAVFHSLVCLTTVPQPLPNQVLHRVQRSVPLSISSILSVSLSSTRSCLLLLLRLPFTSILPSLSFINVFQKTVRTQDVTKRGILISFLVCSILLYFMTLCNIYSLLTRSATLIYPTLQYQILKLSKYF